MPRLLQLVATIADSLPFALRPGRGASAGGASAAAGALLAAAACLLDQFGLFFHIFQLAGADIRAGGGARCRSLAAAAGFGAAGDVLQGVASDVFVFFHGDIAQRNHAHQLTIFHHRQSADLPPRHDARGFLHVSIRLNGFQFTAENVFGS